MRTFPASPAGSPQLDLGLVLPAPPAATAARQLLDVGRIYLEPGVERFPRGRELLARFPNAERREKPVTNEELFRKGVIGPAELSLVTSQLAVEKATDKDAKEFAGFELTEAIAVTTVLKELGTPVPTPDAKAKATLEKLKTAAKGAEFDRACIMAHLENHEFLRDHAADFLKNSPGKGSMAEPHGQHLATLARATFKEHVAICKRISGGLKA